jgi:hypothetical protein
MTRSKMRNQKQKSASIEGKTEASEAQLRMVLQELRRPAYALDCIGGEGEPSLEEYKARRDADYDELYRDAAIPRDLITAVKEFRDGAAVSWVSKDGRPSTPTDRSGIPIVEEQQNNDVNVMAESERDKSDLNKLFSSSLPKTAREALAMCLRGRLEALREAGSAPVRFGKMVPQSVIARIAVDMLEDGTQLTELIRELLEVDRRSATGDREFAARHQGDVDQGSEGRHRRKGPCTAGRRKCEYHYEMDERPRISRRDQGSATLYRASKKKRRLATRRAG